MTEMQTMAYDVFASLLKRWMAHEQKDRAAVIEACQDMIAYCDTQAPLWAAALDGRAGAAYYPELKKLLLQFLELLGEPALLAE